MAVTPVDLISPVGELSRDMFPDLEIDLEATVGVWILQAQEAATTYDLTVVDQAVKAWVYSRAYRAVSRRLALEPDSASAEGISQTIGENRIRYFERLASQYEEEFVRLGVVPEEPEPSFRGTRSVKTQVYF